MAIWCHYIHRLLLPILPLSHRNEIVQGKDHSSINYVAYARINASLCTQCTGSLFFILMPYVRNISDSFFLIVSSSYFSTYLWLYFASFVHVPRSNVLSSVFTLRILPWSFPLLSYHSITELATTVLRLHYYSLNPYCRSPASFLPLLLYYHDHYYPTRINSVSSWLATVLPCSQHFLFILHFLSLLFVSLLRSTIVLTIDLLLSTPFHFP